MATLLLTRPRSAAGFPPAELATLAIIALLGLCITIGTVRLPLRYDGQGLNPVFLVLTLLWFLGAWVAERGGAAVGAACRAVAMLLALAILAALTSVVLAHSALPLADRRLAAIDALLVPGWDWAAMAPRMARLDGDLLRRLSWAYASLNWQPLLLVGLLAVRGRLAALGRFVLAWAMTLAVSLAIFPFVPALGVHLTYRLAHTAMPGVLINAAWDHVRLLGAAREWRLEALSSRTLDGIVTFPSFHVAGAVLLAWGYRRAGLAVFVPAAGLNLAMIVSAFPIGGHYLVDGLAGALIAGAAIMVANRVGQADVAG